MDHGGGYRPRYNKSLDSLDTADCPVNQQSSEAASHGGFYQSSSRGSEGDILGLGSHSSGLTAPSLVSRYLHDDDGHQAEADDHLPDLQTAPRRRLLEYPPSPTTPGPSRLLCDRVDPEDSIRDMVSENDFYRFVLFKRHYEKYLRLSQKYEEARNIAYYLEEKYHEIKAERDVLAQARRELERRVEQREAQLLDKDEELFLQLERVVRLEDECDKLRAEKERFTELQRQLQEERDAALRQVRSIQEQQHELHSAVAAADLDTPAPRPPLPDPAVLWQMRQQAGEAEHQRRGLERARCDVVRQATIIAREKENLERENEQLREALSEERRGMNSYLEDLSDQKKRAHQSISILEKELSELQLVSQQTCALNSQFKKAMKHLATCKRRKCSVCNYTRAAFGDYADRYRHQRKFLSCIQAPLEDLRHWIRPASAMDKHSPGGSSIGHDEMERHSIGGSLHDREDLLHSSPARAPAISGPSGISYIDSDESSSSSEGEDEVRPVSTSSYEEEEDEERGLMATSLLPTDASLTSGSTAAGRAFSSDSGFSSELCDSKAASARDEGGDDATPSPPPAKSTLHRSKWTSSFRKLIHRVSKR